MAQPPTDTEPVEVKAVTKGHWYTRFSEGGRSFFWSVYFGIFVLAAVSGIGIALVHLLADGSYMMTNPTSSIAILITGTTGEMWCLHRNLSNHTLGKPGKNFARWGIWVAGSSLAISFLLAIGIVAVYFMQGHGA